MSNCRSAKNVTPNTSASERKLARPTNEQILARTQTVGRFFTSVQQIQTEKKLKKIMDERSPEQKILKEIQEMKEQISPAEMKIRIKRLGELLRGHQQPSALSVPLEENAADDDQPSQRKCP